MRLRIIILVTVDFCWELSRIALESSDPSHTNDNDGDDAEDNDTDVLLACWWLLVVPLLLCVRVSGTA